MNVIMAYKYQILMAIKYFKKKKKKKFSGGSWFDEQHAC